MKILLLYLILFAVKFIFETVLEILNTKKSLNSKEIPLYFRGNITQDSYERSVKYTAVKGRFSILSSAVESAFLLLIILSGSFGKIEQFILSFGIHPYLQGILIIFLVSFIFYLIGLPFSIYSRFVIEKNFGFNTATPALFAADQVKSLVIGSAVAFPVLLVIFWFMDSAGGFWWIYAFIFVAFFQLLINFLYPVLIAPVFNRFEPLAGGDLKETLQNLSEKLDFRINGIFTMDGSRRSRHSNAYFTGFGKYRRIVLFDTLINLLDVREIEAVLAHEIGHYKLGHLIKGIILSMFVLFFSFFIINVLLDYDPLYRAFGFNGSSYYGIILVLSLCSSPFTFFLSPFINSWTRKHEYEADRFAVVKADAKENLKKALLNLGEKNLSNLNPHKLYSFYHYSHPALLERLSAIDSIN